MGHALCRVSCKVPEGTRRGGLPLGRVNLTPATLCPIRPLCDAPSHSTGGPQPRPRGSLSLEVPSDPSTACTCPCCPRHGASSPYGDPLGRVLPPCLPGQVGQVPSSHLLPPLHHLAVQKTLQSGWICSGPRVPPWETLGPTGEVPGLACLPFPHTPPVPQERGLLGDVPFSGSAAWCLT